MTPTVSTNQGVIERAISKLPPRLAHPGPDLDKAKLTLEEQAQYYVGRVLVNAACNTSQMLGGEIHGRTTFNTADFDTKSELDALVRSMKVVIDKLFWPDYTFQVVSYIIEPSTRVSPLPASDITVILKPR